MGAVLLAARTEIDLARLLLERNRNGDGARARVLLERALETAPSFDAPGLSARIDPLREALLAPTVALLAGQVGATFRRAPPA